MDNSICKQIIYKKMLIKAEKYCFWMGATGERAMGYGKRGGEKGGGGRTGNKGREMGKKARVSGRLS